MDDTKAEHAQPELQVGAPADKPRALSIFEVTEGEWWIGSSLEECVDAAAKEWGIGDAERKTFFEDAHQLSDEAIYRLMFCYDENDLSKRRTFRAELERRAADPDATFPQFFASTEV